VRLDLVQQWAETRARAPNPGFRITDEIFFGSDFRVPTHGMVVNP
jgi:hypothetical protein